MLEDFKGTVAFTYDGTYYIVGKRCDEGGYLFSSIFSDHKGSGTYHYDMKIYSEGGIVKGHYVCRVIPPGRKDPYTFKEDFFVSSSRISEEAMVMDGEWPEEGVLYTFHLDVKKVT